MSTPTDSLYGEARQSLWDHMSIEHNCCLLESECFELWQVATASCRKEIVRLERLLAFQERGRAEDCQRQNEIVCRLLNP